MRFSRNTEAERRERGRDRKRDVEWTTAGQCRGGIKIVDPHENGRRESRLRANDVLRACVGRLAMRRDVNQVYYNVRRLSQIARSRALRAALTPRSRVARARAPRHSADEY